MFKKGQIVIMRNGDMYAYTRTHSVGTVMDGRIRYVSSGRYIHVRWYFLSGDPEFTSCEVFDVWVEDLALAPEGISLKNLVTRAKILAKMGVGHEQ